MTLDDCPRLFVPLTHRGARIGGEAHHQVFVQHLRGGVAKVLVALVLKGDDLDNLCLFDGHRQVFGLHVGRGDG